MKGITLNISEFPLSKLQFNWKEVFLIVFLFSNHILYHVSQILRSKLKCVENFLFFNYLTKNLNFLLLNHRHIFPVAQEYWNRYYHTRYSSLLSPNFKDFRDMVIGSSVSFCNTRPHSWGSKSIPHQVWFFSRHDLCWRAVALVGGRTDVYTGLLSFVALTKYVQRSQYS